MRVSFVIPTFNNAAWLAPAIESCQKQTFPEIEIIVVDDCSTDSTPRLLKYLSEKDRRIVVFVNKENKGRSFSRNFGNEMSSGDVICVLDSDDMAYPERARLTVDKINKGAEFVYGSTDNIDAIGTIMGEEVADAFDLKVAEESLLNRIVHSTVGYTRSVANRFKYRDGDVSRLGIDDWAQQIDCAYDGVKFDFIPRKIGIYRFLDTAITATRSQSEVNALKREILSQMKSLKKV